MHFVQTCLERPVEAQIDPQFEVMTDVQSQSLYRQAFHLWFQRRQEDLPEGIRRFLRRRSRESGTEALFKAGWELTDWRDFPTRWRREAFAGNRRSIVSWKTCITLPT